MALVHHELCFGCGRTNLFGLLLDAVETSTGTVTGRCFIKQDHQGAERGTAHEGILAAALSEAMALACGTDARTRTLEVQLSGAAPVGEFVRIEAQQQGRHGEVMHATAVACVEERQVGRARGSFQSPSR